jgi:uncharacterized Zn-finger protein
MKRLVAIVMLLAAAQIGHAMNHPSKGMLCLPANNNNDLTLEDEDNQDVEHIDKKIKTRKTYLCPHVDCANHPPFASHSGLALHNLSHAATIEEQRPHLCRIEGCNARFSQTGHRDSHELTHTGEKPYVCTYENCNKCFVRKSDCARHIQCVHLGKKDFQCLECGLNCSRESNLIAHLRTHTGEKPYECECGKQYSRSDTLKVHKRTCPKLLALHNNNDDLAANEVSPFNIAVTLLALAKGNPNAH